MDTLPDVLVLSILSKVGDGLMLLDVLPLVCQRWRDLCWDPAAWAEVDVHWKTCKVPEDSDARCLSSVMRLILHAPALRTLRIDWDFGDCCNSKVMSALRRSRVVVRDSFQVGLEAWTRTCHDGRVAFLDTLWRSRKHVRAASVALYLEENNSTVDSEGHTLLQVVASLEQLHWLAVDGTSKYPYTGELENRLPHLRYLALNLGGATSGVLPEALVLDLIRGATSLRSLALGSDYGRLAHPFLEILNAVRDNRNSAKPALLECISKCTDLRVLSGPYELAIVWDALPHLEAVAIKMNPAAEESDDLVDFLSRVLPLCMATTAPLKSVQLFVCKLAFCFRAIVAGGLWGWQQQRGWDEKVAEFKASKPDVNLSIKYI